MAKKIDIHQKLVASFYAIAGLLIGMFGVLYLFNPSGLIKYFPDNDYLQNMSSREFIIWGLVLLFLGILEIYFALKLLQKSRIAITIATTISIMGVIWALYGLFQFQGYENIVFIGLHSYFVWALWGKWEKIG